MARTVVAKRCLAVVGAAVLLGMADPAAAQSLQPSPGDGGSWFIGAGGGLAVVQHAGGLLSGEIGWRPARALDLIGEVVWMQDTATRRRIETAESLAAHLQATQGTPTTATLDAPASAFIGQVRWAFGAGRLRPYVSGGGGISRVTLRTTVMMGGQDVTGRLEDFGVSLGSDLTGIWYRPTVTGGLGVLVGHDRWTFDAGFRLLSIVMPDQTTNVLTAKGSVSYGF